MLAQRTTLKTHPHPPQPPSFIETREEEEEIQMKKKSREESGRKASQEIEPRLDFEVFIVFSVLFHTVKASIIV